MEIEAQATEFQKMLDARGVSRRSFMKLCGAVAVAAGLSELAAPKVAQALEDSVIGATEGNLFPVIWIEGASCTGCTESFAQVDTPDPATVVLEMLSLNYSETLSAAAGWSMEEAKEQTIKNCDYILVYEGAILEGWNGQALRVANKPGTEHLIEAAENAQAVVALGSCAVNGGWMAAHPNPSNAMGVQKFLRKNGIETPVINIPGCPANPEWLVAVLVKVLYLKTLPALDAEGKPSQIFGQTIHDNCERRGHFENGEFVYKFGSEEEAKGYCLYALGCRGPQTKSNCGVTMWNHGRTWCVQAGSPCIGCCEADPNDPGHNWVEVNTPFYERQRDLRIGSLVLQPRTIALGLTGLVAAALVIHGFGMKKTGRTDGGAPFEEIREWDKRNPEKSIGQYDQAVWDKVNAEKAGVVEKTYEPQIIKSGEVEAAEVAAPVAEAEPAVEAAPVAEAAAPAVAATAAVASAAGSWRDGTVGAEEGIEDDADAWKATISQEGRKQSAAKAVEGTPAAVKALNDEMDLPTDEGWRASSVSAVDEAQDVLSALGETVEKMKGGEE